MLQQMINAGIAIITRPSVSAFEEHEQNNLNWALIYTLIGAVITAILTAIQVSIFPSANTLGTESQGLVGLVIGALFGSIIFFFIYFGIVYGLGRAFGGTGQFGELAYDISLFAVPFGVLRAILGFIPFLGGIAAFALSIYGLYLTYLGIQAGLNVPKDKALYVMLVLAGIALVLACILIAIFGAAFYALVGVPSEP